MTPQEQLLQTMLQFATGNCFTFKPHNLKKGTATREPCDVAWVRDDVAVFCYATTEAKAPAEHNITQFRGWLRLWETNDQRFRLTGRNDSFDFDVGFADREHHVMLSVIEGGANSYGEWHPPREAGIPSHQRTALMLTLPDSVLQYIFHTGGGMHEIVDVAIVLRDAGRTMTEAELLAVCEARVRGVRHNYVVHRGVDDKWFRRAQDMVRNAMVSAIQGNRQDPGDPLRILADLRIDQLTALTIKVAQVRIEIDSVPDNGLGLRHLPFQFDLYPYGGWFLIAAADAFDRGVVNEWLDNFLHIEKAFGRHGGLGIAWWELAQGAWMSVLTAKPRDAGVPSLLAKRLGALAKHA